MGYVGEVKDRHIEACLGHDVEQTAEAPGNGFERYRLVGEVPDFDFAELDPSIELFGRRLTLPLFISSLTGGGRSSGRINQNLAEAAQALGIGMGVGSQRLMLEHPETSASYQIRQWAPEILLFANLGLVHLNYGLDEGGCRRAVEGIGADALILYVNPLHEVFQSSGSLNFRGLFQKLERLCQSLPCPVIVKEVGFGLSAATLRRLASTGVAAVDVAGRGGTDWALVERAMGRGGSVGPYGELGVPTAESLEAALRVLPGQVAVLASGGIRTGIEMAKAVAMGAQLAGVGLPFLRWAHESAERVVREGERLGEELRIAMWYAGAPNLSALRGKIARRA